MLHSFPTLHYLFNKYKRLNQLQMTQAKPFIFLKRGLTPNEFEDCLTSKVDQLFEGFNTHRIKTLMTNSVKEVRKNVCIRENRRNNHLDRRHSVALFNLVVNDLLSNEAATPMLDKQNTGGIPGTRRSDRRIVASYHDKQHRLFSELLIPKFGDVFHNIYVKENNKGFFFWRDNDEKLTPEECCNVIDQITTEYIKYFFQLHRNAVNPDHNNDQRQAELQAERNDCMSILSGRVVVDWCTENNLMVQRDYKEWKSHVMVEMSFAALTVVLAMIMSRLDKGWKPLCMPPANTVTVVNNGYFTLVNVVFVLSVVTSTVVKIGHSC